MKLLTPCLQVWLLTIAGDKDLLEAIPQDVDGRRTKRFLVNHSCISKAISFILVLYVCLLEYKTGSILVIKPAMSVKNNYRIMILQHRLIRTKIIVLHLLSFTKGTNSSIKNRTK